MQLLNRVLKRNNRKPYLNHTLVRETNIHDIFNRMSVEEFVRKGYSLTDRQINILKEKQAYIELNTYILFKEIRPKVWYILDNIREEGRFHFSNFEGILIAKDTQSDQIFYVRNRHYSLTNIEIIGNFNLNHYEKEAVVSFILSEHKYRQRQEDDLKNTLH